MLQATVERIAPIIPAERIFISTGPAYAELVAEQLPELLRENILIEPAGRGTAPCIGLAALHLRRRHPDAVMAVLSADHRIGDADQLCAALAFGDTLAQQNHLVALGIEPSTPSTAYGYMRRGRLIEQHGSLAAHAVGAFAEKPDPARARDYLARGDYLWNAGIFVWRAERILEELALHRPELAEALACIDQALEMPERPAALRAAWEAIDDLAIDVAVMERTERAVVIPCAFDWSDIGDWATFAELQPVDEYGNAVVGAHVGLNTYDSLIYAGRRVVATIGVTELVIVDTDDALLICPRERAQDVQAIVAHVREQHRR
jgi:mannose-1-phosphate guanylyltransferase